GARPGGRRPRAVLAAARGVRPGGGAPVALGTAAADGPAGVRALSGPAGAAARVRRGGRAARHAAESWFDGRRERWRAKEIYLPRSTSPRLASDDTPLPRHHARRRRPVTRAVPDGVR